MAVDPMAVDPTVNQRLVCFQTTCVQPDLKSMVLCGVHLKAVDAMLSIASMMR